MQGFERLFGHDFPRCDVEIDELLDGLFGCKSNVCWLGMMERCEERLLVEMQLSGAFLVGDESQIVVAQQTVQPAVEVFGLKFH